jgi:NDP-sugar pyrophosphorylase family protein
LEYDIFPRVLNKPVYGFPCMGPFIDIGIPTRYLQAKDIIIKK